MMAINILLYYITRVKAESKKSINDPKFLARLTIVPKGVRLS